jgi:hypothetical protein
VRGVLAAAREDRMSFSKDAHESWVKKMDQKEWLARAHDLAPGARRGRSYVLYYGGLTERPDSGAEPFMSSGPRPFGENHVFSREFSRPRTN